MAGMVTLQLGLEVNIEVPLQVSLEGKFEGALHLAVAPWKYEKNLLSSDESSSDDFHLDYNRSYIDSAGYVSLSAGLGIKTRLAVEPKICFLIACAGASLELDHEIMVGADIGMTTTVGPSHPTYGDGDGCNEWTFHSKFTPYNEYNEMQMKVLSDAVDAAQGNLIFAGGYWMYVTYPWFRISGFLTSGILMSIGCDDDDGPTASVTSTFYDTHDNREYKPDTQLALFEKKHPIVPVDDQGRALYFYRTAGAFAMPLTQGASKKGRHCFTNTTACHRVYPNETIYPNETVNKELLPPNETLVPFAECLAPAANWRYTWGGAAVEMAVGVVAYGAMVTQTTCFQACSAEPMCKQAVFSTQSSACYPMNTADASDQDGLGGTNVNWVSIRCHSLTPELTTGAQCATGACGVCTGDCDADSDCGPGLYCFQRTATEPVPGCAGEGMAGYDYCSAG